MIRRRDFAQPDPDYVRLRNGEVTAVDAASGTASVVLGGAPAAEAVPGVHMLAGATVAVGAKVKVLQARHSLLIIGQTQ